MYVHTIGNKKWCFEQEINSETFGFIDNTPFQKTINSICTIIRGIKM